MIRRPPRATRTDTLFPYTTLFRSHAHRAPAKAGAQDHAAHRSKLWAPAFAGAQADAHAPRSRPLLQCTQPPRLIARHREQRIGLCAALARSEEGRVGNACVSTCSTRGSPNHKKKKTNKREQRKEENDRITT